MTKVIGFPSVNKGTACGMIFNRECGAFVWERETVNLHATAIQIILIYRIQTNQPDLIRVLGIYCGVWGPSGVWTAQGCQSGLGFLYSSHPTHTQMTLDGLTMPSVTPPSSNVCYPMMNITAYSLRNVNRSSCSSKVVFAPLAKCLTIVNFFYLTKLYHNRESNLGKVLRLPGQLPLVRSTAILTLVGIAGNDLG